MAQQRPKAPPTGYAKIHVDAGVRKGRSGAATVVCRDGNGQYSGSSSLVKEGVDDSTTLEAITCREGITLAADRNVQNFIIASDSKQAVSHIARCNRGIYGAIISEINLHVSQLHCKITFEGCAVNYEAHCLAKFSLLLGPRRQVWLGQPHDLNCIPLSVDFDE